MTSLIEVLERIAETLARIASAFTGDADPSDKPFWSEIPPIPGKHNGGRYYTRPGGYAPVLELYGGTYDSEVLGLLSRFGHLWNFHIRGVNPGHSCITVPVHFRAPYWRLENVTIAPLAYIPVEDHNGEARTAALVTENGITGRMEDVTIEGRDPHGWCWIDCVTEAGRPPPNWKDNEWRQWPARFSDSVGGFYRSSLGTFDRVEFRTLGGGGFYAVKKTDPVTGDGSFHNHLTFTDCHFYSSVDWGDVKSSLGLAPNREDWVERYGSLPKFEIGPDVKACLNNTHLDAFPHCGIWAHEGTRIEVHCVSRHVEPNVSDSRAPSWDPTKTKGPWIIGGPGVTAPRLGDDIGRCIDAGAVLMFHVPKYVFAEHWFEPTAEW